jgi:hypothetical protein
MPTEELKKEIDINNDGIIDTYEQMVYERKAKNRRRMAWVSLFALIISGLGLIFFVPESRLEKLNDILDLYWISLATIVGAYVGISTWLSKTK